jgi:hypothetical protein
VLGDANLDIFNGLAVSHGLLSRARYVPAERVTRIVEGTIELDLGPGEFDRLRDADEPPPVERIAE